MHDLSDLPAVKTTIPTPKRSALTLRAELPAELPTRKRQVIVNAWQKLVGKPADAPERARFAELIKSAQAALAQRRARIPKIALDDALPISACATELILAMQTHQVIIVAGETGSGKSTQLPKLALAAGLGVRGLIGCTQPRRIAAKSVATRVAEELKSTLGGLVGYQVRFTEQSSEQTLIKFMTDGILLAETQSDRYLSAYDTLIIDEAHERSLNIDFLLGFVKKLLQKRRDLKLIITSATIDTARFSKHFDNAPVFVVEGRGFPVTLRYRPIAGDAEERSDRALLSGVINAVRELDIEDPMADILIFFPGEREINDAKRALEKAAFRLTEVVPLYAKLSAAQQELVFKPGAKRRLVLASNVAETSITVPRIRAVIDTGTARIARYSPRSKIERLHIEDISQASANQRAGRCGRISAGICVRLYDETSFQLRPAFTDPEILRSSLAGVLLRMLRLNLGDPRLFPFVEPPDERAINDGFLVLRELGAISAERTLTDIGRQMAEFPIDVHYARMLVAAKLTPQLDQTLVLSAGLSIQDPRERPLEAREQAQAAHAMFADERSDFLSLLKLWDAYQHQRVALKQSQLRDWAKRSFLSFMRLREWQDLYQQLKERAREQGWQVQDAPTPALSVQSARALTAPTRRAPNNPRAGKPSPEPVQRNWAKASAAEQKRHADALGVASPAITHAKAAANPEPSTASQDKKAKQDYAALHKVLLSALLTQCGEHEEKGLYSGTRSRNFQIFPGSSVKGNPRWIMADALLDTQKVWAMGAAQIEPLWLEELGQHLIKRRHYDPHWDEQSGCARCYEDQNLLGLLVVRKRRVLFEPIDATAARTLFLFHAMARGETNAPHRLLAHNAKIRQEAIDKEDKLRTRGLLKNDSDLAEWFASRIPEAIRSVPALMNWLRTPEGKLAEPGLRLGVMDLMNSDQPKLREFPDELQAGGFKLPLRYHFDPSSELDGATIALKLEQLGAVSAARLSWLVPGLREEKIVAMIKTLPKNLRRLVVPAPDFARAFLEACEPSEEWLQDVLASFFQRISGAEFTASDFDIAALAPHLSFRIEVLGPAGEVLRAARDIAALQIDYRQQAAAAFTAKVGALYNRTGLKTWPFDLPLAIRSDDGSNAFPALFDESEHSAGLKAFAQQTEADAAHAGGALRLLRLHLPEELRYWRKHIALSSAAVLAYAAVDSSENLRADLVEAAFLQVAGVEAQSVRSQAEFHRMSEHVRAQLGPICGARSQLVNEALESYSAVKRRLVQPVIGFAKANFDDVSAQLNGLIFKGFARQISPQQLVHYARYFKALGIRLDRLFHDPVKDQSKMLDVLPFMDKLKASPNLADSRFRWLLEEFRVAVFAPELKTAEPVSAKKLQSALNS